MESRAKYTLVGTVVLGLIILGGSFLWWISRSRDDADYEFYQAYFKRFSLSGMQVNSAVTMRGIKVGTVESLHISASDIEAVLVVLRIQSNTPVKESTRAVVERNLLTGLASIDLVGTTSESKLLLRTPGERYPTIPEGPAPLVALADNIPQLIEKAARTIDRLELFLTPENADTVKETLVNIKDISAELNKRKAVFTHFADDVDGLRENATNLIEDARQSIKNASSAIVQALDAVTAEIARTGQSVSNAADTVASTAKNYEDPRAILSRPGADSFGPGEDIK